MRLTRKKNNGRSGSKKKQLLTTVEYRHFQLLRIVNLITIFIFGTILGIAGMFLHNRIYTVIGQAQNILNLERPEISGNAIDFLLLDKVEKEWNQKYSIEPVTISRDPFNIVVENTPRTIEASTSTPATGIATTTPES